ncbi:complex I NDUFA9 subunit family protein [Caulobacter sp. KR2-114]|uniref:complex I NDUFA9 subunit family protein n=1 Tax=Caulobacter sp. KR2-114 TaxID=3400912 RepID=UPI003C04A0A2
MKGLVTVFGGSGFVGGQIVRALARKGLRVRVAVRRPGRGYRLRMLGDVGQIEVVQANVRDAASVGRALDGAEGVVNCVAVLHEFGGQTFDALHVEGATAIAEAAAARGIDRFVQISAIGADPASPARYGRSKAEGEAAVRSRIPAAVVIRPSIVFGQDDHFFNSFAQMAQMSPVLPLIGGGETKFQPVFVGDVAAAVARAITDPDCAGKTYELGGPAPHSFKALMELLLAEIHRKRALVPVPFGVASVLGFVGDLLCGAHGVLGLIPLPPITSDQVEMLKADNVVSPGALGLADLGVTPTALEPILPTYLYRYRRGGQYAEAMASV